MFPSSRSRPRGTPIRASPKRVRPGRLAGRTGENRVERREISLQYVGSNRTALDKPQSASSARPCVGLLRGVRLTGDLAGASRRRHPTRRWSTSATSSGSSARYMARRRTSRPRGATRRHLLLALCENPERIVPDWRIIENIWNVYIRVDDADAGLCRGAGARRGDRLHDLRRPARISRVRRAGPGRPRHRVRPAPQRLVIGAPARRRATRARAAPPGRARA